MVITIDGPAGAGKSTMARRLATALGISFLDTGATYRTVTLRALQAGDDLTAIDALLRHAREMDLQLLPHPDGIRVMMDSQDVSQAIRTENVSRNARYAANNPAIREVLVGLQRRIGRELGDFVTEGRDQGSVVFPDADVKFYLDASCAHRARRRCDELAQRGLHTNYDEVLQAILARDESDASRTVGPLCVPDGAIRVDTSDKTIEQTLDELLRHVRKKME